MTEPVERTAAGAIRGPELVAWAAVLAVLAWLYLSNIISMAANWWADDNYSHGFLVPLISAGLLWRQRAQLARDTAGPDLRGLVVIAASLLVLLLGEMAHEFFLRRVSLVPLLWGLALLAWGWPVAKRCLFAFTYLLLMVPLPYILYDTVAFPLRLVAAQIAAWVLRLTGLPVNVEGNVINLPNVVLDVVDACSGIRSLISLLAVGAILAYLMLPNRWLKVLVAVLVLPVAVVTNALRVTAAGLLAEHVGPQTLEGAMHDTVGWVVFMAAFGALAVITWLLARLADRWAEGRRDRN